MEKFICIDTGGIDTLTLNKVYDGIVRGSPFYPNVLDIIDDKGVERIFLQKWFMSVSELRSKKLNDIGI
jgi:hypothetical protein